MIVSTQRVIIKETYLTTSLKIIVLPMNVFINLQLTIKVFHFVMQ